MGNPITWFDIVAPDPGREAKFYSDLFGWHTKHLPEWNYYLIDTHGPDEGHGRGNAINGGIAQMHDDHPVGCMIYVENADIQPLLDKAESLGAKTAVRCR
jgi:predicted enzyme related to lactoylglutathione lyase